MVPGRVGLPLAVVLLSAAGVPPFPPWRPGWDPRVVAGRATRAAWPRRLPVAPPLGVGPLARVWAQTGLPRGLPVPVCRQFPPPRLAWLPVFALGLWDPLGGSRPGALARGASAGTVARVGSGSGSRSGFGGRAITRWRFRGPYRQSGWWVVVLLGRRLSLCRGRRMAPWARCAGCRWSLGTGALGGVVAVGTYGAEGSLGPGAGVVGRGSGTCLCGGAFGRRVCGALCRPDLWALVWVGLRVGLCRRLPGRLLAGGRVRTRRVVIGVVELGRLWDPGLGSFAGVRCRGVARVRCLLSPYSWGGAWLPSPQVMPGAPGSLRLCRAAVGVVAPPIWMHILDGGSVVCRPPMLAECQ